MGRKPKYRLSIIPGAAPSDPALKPIDLKILNLIGRHTDGNGWCRVKHRTLAADAKCARSTVQASLGRLYAAGYVQRKLRGFKNRPEPDDADQPYLCHAYRVLLDTDDQEAQKLRHRGARQIGHPPDQQIGHPVPAIGENSAKNTDEIRSAPGATAAAETIVADLFDVFETDAPPADDEIGMCRAPNEGLLDEPTLNEPLASDEKRVSDLGPYLPEFIAAWPTSSTDSHSRISAHWGKLTLEERKAALVGVAPFLAELKKNGRERIISGWKYLSERRWQLVTTSASNVHGFDTWSRDWWGVLLAKIDKGERASAWFDYAYVGGSPAKRFCAAKSGDMPSIDQLAMLTQFPSDGDAMAAWRYWFEARGLRFPHSTDRFWVFLPAATPPNGRQSVWARRASEIGRDALGASGSAA